MVDPSVLSLVVGLVKMVNLIVEAGKAASKNKSDCRDLAEHVRTLSNILPPFKAAANDERATRALGELQGVLDDAHELVQSCGGKTGGGFFFSGDSSAKVATRIRDVRTKIDSCVMVLNLVGQTKLLEQNKQLAAAQQAAGGEAVRVLRQPIFLMPQPVGTNGIRLFKEITPVPSLRTLKQSTSHDTRTSSTTPVPSLRTLQQSTSHDTRTSSTTPVLSLRTLHQSTSHDTPMSSTTAVPSLRKLRQPTPQADTTRVSEKPVGVPSLRSRLP